MKAYYKRKGMAYGGGVRKPMNMGGMMSSAPAMQQKKQPTNPMQPTGMMGTTTPMQPTGMKYGGNIKGDLDKDGKMSRYEAARQKAIEKNMKKT